MSAKLPHGYAEGLPLDEEDLHWIELLLLIEEETAEDPDPPFPGQIIRTSELK